MKRLMTLLALGLLAVGCSEKSDEKGKVPFGLENPTNSTPEPTLEEKGDAAAEAGKNDSGSSGDSGVDGGDAALPLTPAQQVREAILQSLQTGKLDDSLKAEPLKNVEKVGALTLRGVVPPVSLSRLVFREADNQLEVRGSEGGRYDLRDNTFVPGPSEAAAIGDRSGTHVIVETKTSCEGTRLVIAKSEEIVAGVLAGKPVSKPWVRQNPDPTRCSKRDLTPQIFEVLGWTGQGIVFVLDGEFFVQESPLASDVVPRKLEFVAGLPAPLPGGRASTDGRTVLLPTKVGLLVYVAGQLPRLLTHPDIDAKSEVAVAATGTQSFAYWTHEGSLYRALLPR